MTTVEISAASTIAGFILRLIYDLIKESLRFRRELRQNQQIDLTGEDWVAAWQTSVDNKELLNTENVIIKQKGALVKIHNREKSPENPEAGFKWTGQMQFFQGRDLMGHYFSIRAEQNTNKGIMYFNYDSAKKRLIGRWVGNSYDGPLLSGFGVITKNRNMSLDLLKEIIRKHPDKVPVISYAF